MVRWRDVLSLAALAVFGALALALVVGAWQGARKATVESGQRSLLVQAERQLATYHAEHGKYPDSLARLQFEFHEGADDSTVARLEYQTDRKYYRIVTKSDWGGSEISVCR